MTCAECDKLGWPTKGQLHGVNGVSLCWAHAQIENSKETVQTALQAILDAPELKLNCDDETLQSYHTRMTKVLNRAIGWLSSDVRNGNPEIRKHSLELLAYMLEVAKEK